MITVSDEITDHNMKAFVKVFSIMAPVRDTLIFHLESTSKDEWKAMTDVLTKKGIKTEQFLDVSTPKENYYSSEGIFLHLNEQEDCHSMMKYLEEAELELKCLLFDSSFDFTNPEGDNYCPQPKAGVGFVE